MRSGVDQDFVFKFHAPEHSCWSMRGAALFDAYHAVVPSGCELVYNEAEQDDRLVPTMLVPVRCAVPCGSWFVKCGVCRVACCSAVACVFHAYVSPSSKLPVVNVGLTSNATSPLPLGPCGAIVMGAIARVQCAGYVVGRPT